MQSVGRAWERVAAEAIATPPPRIDRVAVLQICSSNERRGAELFAHQLGGELTDSGLSTRTVAIGPSPHPNGLPFRVLGSGRFRPLTLVRLARLMRRSDVTVVHGGPGLWPATVASFLVRRPVIYRSIGDPAYWGAVPFGRFRIGSPLRRAAAVVALYPLAGEQVVEMYGIEPSRVQVIPNAVPSDDFPARTSERRTAARAALGIGSGDGPVLGYLGALSSEKRPDWAIRTVARLDGAELLIAGSGPLEEEMRVLADRLAPGRVHFLGSIERQLPLLDSLDLLLLPSRTEGMPASVIESALVGVPVVGTAVGGAPVVVEELRAGLVVDPDDLDAFVEAARSVLAATPPTEPDRPAAVAAHDIAQVAARWRELLVQVVPGLGPTAT
jgi:glycosyltransferase involved in cell wall biosynthesis